MGPEYPSDEHVDKITLELLAFLQDQYEIFKYENEFPIMDRARAKVIEEFRKAIWDILYQDNCEGF